MASPQMANNLRELATLPVELLHSIFRRLDPVGLIAASQTCTHFRTIIKPAKKHFAERLLALEIEPAHGGPGYVYFARENRLEPDWQEDVWNDMRWACTHCLKLLPHTAFDNHSLLRLRNRKPAPGTPAARRCSGVTSWEPVQERALTAKDMRRKKVRVAEEKAEEKALKKQYHLATTKSLNETRATYTIQTRTQYLRAAELPEILSYSDSQLDHLTEAEEHAILDRAALRIESLRAGSHRTSRYCNECLFQLGRFKRAPVITRRAPTPGQSDEWSFGNNKGTPEVPFVRSRRLKFATPFDRYFPGIGAPYMRAERPNFVLPLWRVHRQDKSYMPSTLYMARCPSCTIWQELREFRWPPRGWAYGEFIGVGLWMTEAEVAAHQTQANAIQCNKCMHKQQGHAVLAQHLSTFMRARLKTECRAALSILSGGWRSLTYLEAKSHYSRKSPIKDLIASLEAAEKKFMTVKHQGGHDWSEIDVEAEDLEDILGLMSRRRQEWLHIAMQNQGLAKACVNGSEEFRVWHEEWDEAIQYWRWAKAWMEEVEEEPEKVVKWALERDSRRLE